MDGSSVSVTTITREVKPARLCAKPPARRWLRFRFSLRTLMIVMTAVCLVCGLWMNRAIRQRTAVRHFYELTAKRSHSHGENPVTMGYRYNGKDEYSYSYSCSQSNTE